MQFELEIQKVHESYESLVHSSQKRERLERIMKLRLEDEIKKLQAQNRIYRGKLYKFNIRPVLKLLDLLKKVLFV